MMNNVFETIKQTISKDDLKDFISNEYGIEFKANNANAFCPFHDHNFQTPSLGVSANNNGAFFHCFACNTSGDITKFVELKENISPLQAAKKVCEYFNIPCDINAQDLSEEEKKERAKKLEAIKRQNKERRAKDNEQKQELIKKNIIAIGKIAPTLIRDLEINYSSIKDTLEESFHLYFMPIFKDISKDLLGYSLEHKSLAIIIRDKNNNPINIRYRQKFKYDSTHKMLTNERMDGKWIGQANMSSFPFPLSLYGNHTDDKVIICEGEKDALNLYSVGVRALTLGGVNNSFEPYKALLKDKTVYIWFDNDEAGYENAIKKYHELKDVAKNIYVVLFYAISKKLPPKYDISDFIGDNIPKLHANTIYDLISYSCFKVSNVLIDEICDYYPKLSKKLEKFREIEPLKEFIDIKKEIIQKDDNGNYINIFPVKGELDDEFIDRILDKTKALKKELGNERYDLLKDLYLRNFVVTETETENFERWTKSFDEAFKISKTMRSNYHQTHIVDMVESLNQSFYKLGYILGEYKGNLYVWTNNHYMKIEINSMAKFIHSYWMKAARVDLKKQTRPNVDLIVADLISLAINLDEIKARQQRRVINMLNGTIFISKNGKVTFKDKHDHKDGATNILKFHYDPNATCPKWNRFLSQVMSDSDDEKTLMEFIGYCLLPSHDYESFLFLYGKSGANGKSVILDTLKSFFGDDNISALQLQQFEGHQLHALTNKIINIGSEIDKNSSDKGQLANLKAIVSPKDNLQINPKNQEPYLLLPNEKPKLAFAGNEKPRQGLDNAVFRRMLLISFDKEVKDGQKIRGLSDRFADEMAGIFNLAIAGLARLITNGKFTRSRRMQNELEEYKDEVNPIRAFVRDAIIQDENYFIPSKYLYAVYKNFIEDKGGTPLKEKNFFKAFRDECLMNNIVTSYEQKRLQSHYLGLTNDRPYCIVGVRINLNIDFDSVSFGGQQIFINTMSVRKGAELASI